MSILHLTENIKGRDFVVGDIHGCYSYITDFFNAVGFSPEKDRLISVGDFVDRGPNSIDCALLVNRPWFYSVMGNHEEMAVDFYNDFTISGRGEWWPYNGGNWGLSIRHHYSDESRLIHAAIEKFKALPDIITVDKRGGGLFHVIHAELDAIEGITDSALADLETFTKYALRETLDGPTIRWGRGAFYDAAFKEIDEALAIKFSELNRRYGYSDKFNNVSTIYSGHTIVLDPLQYGKLVNIDTGAYLSTKEHEYRNFGLTFIEPETGKFWKVNRYGVNKTLTKIIPL